MLSKSKSTGGTGTTSSISMIGLGSCFEANLTRFLRLFDLGVGGMIELC